VSVHPARAQQPEVSQPAELAPDRRDSRAETGAAEAAAPWPADPWPDICDQFGQHLLVLAEQLRTSLDELEADEGDPEQLRRLYQVDHAVTRMRRTSRDLRTLAGRGEEDLAGFTTSLLDVTRMALSAIERYTQVTVGRVTDLAVLGYATDDIGALMAALLDNATRYSPGTVTVSGQLLGDGGVMFRIEDSGIGIGAEQLDALNAALAGPVPDVDEQTGRHTGFPVVHRIARKHSVGVRLAARPLPGSGTVAMVTLPSYLLCEAPVDKTQRRPAPAAAGSALLRPTTLAVIRPTTPADIGPSASAVLRPTAVTGLSRGLATGPHHPHHPPQSTPSGLPRREQSGLPAEPRDQQPRHADELPRRERASLRGDEPWRRPREQVPPLTSQQQSAARRAFAEELSAFSLGAALGDSRAAYDIALEEEVKP
jgi:Histidine kinase-, DNA gyrase B-, and HSP90-like ATPase